MWGHGKGRMRAGVGCGQVTTMGMGCRWAPHNSVLLAIPLSFRFTLIVMLAKTSHETRI